MASQETPNDTNLPLRFEVLHSRWDPSHFKVLVFNQNTAEQIYTFKPYKENDPHYRKLVNIVEQGGLEFLYQNLENLQKDLRKINIPSRDWICLALLDLAERDRLNQLSPATQHEILYAMKKEDSPAEIDKLIQYQRHQDVKEKNGEGMLYVNDSFQSWEKSINNKPSITFMPKTHQGLKNLVKWTQEKNLRLRASGYRHSSTDLFSEDKQVLATLLDVGTVTKLPAQHPKMDKNNEFQNIQLVGDVFEENGKKKIKCKLGSATCNYHFQDWVHDPKGGNRQWAIPLNVIISEISFGGSTASMCHGAGINNKTISDLVKEIEFVNVKGELQKISDPKQIKAAAGCFGLLGMVTSITLELNEMDYVNLKPAEKQLVSLTIPPTVNYIPPATVLKNLSRENLQALGDKEKLKQAFADFVNRCENHYYAEWFWFPLQNKCWINSWKTDGDKNKAIRFPGRFATEMERSSTYIANLTNNMLGDWSPLLAKIQTKLMGMIAMSTLPDHLDVHCTLEDALHFQHGIHNIRERMMEMELPIPDGQDGKADWSICQKAWWDVIESVYSEENMKYFPMRMTLEMRITGGSDMLLSPQHNNKRTCSIEMITPATVDKNRWEKFLQEVLDKWCQIKDDKGNYLPIRPHWAKHFDGLYINRDKDWLEQCDDEQKALLKNYIRPDGKISIPILEYLKKIACQKQIAEFKNTLNTICKDGGYELKDLQQRLSNPFLDNLLTLTPKAVLQDQKNNQSVLQNKSFFKPKMVKEELQEAQQEKRLVL